MEVINSASNCSEMINLSSSTFFMQEHSAGLMDTLAVLTVLEAMVLLAVTRSSSISRIISKVATTRRVDVGTKIIEIDCDWIFSLVRK